MLTLGQQIDGRKIRICRFIGDNQYLAGTGQTVNPHFPQYLTLCLCHKPISRSYDHVHLLDRLRTIGKRRHSLGAACLIDFIHTGNIHSHQYRRVNAAVYLRRRAACRDPFYACHLRWDCQHQCRTRQRISAARHISAHRIHRYQLMGKGNAFHLTYVF